MPYTISASILYLGTAISIADRTTIAVPSTTICIGQWIQPVTTPLSCNQSLDLYNVSIGDLRAATNDPFCEIDVDVCLPNPCSLAVINIYGMT